MTTISFTPPLRPPPAADGPVHQKEAAPAPTDVPKPQSPSYFSPVVRIDPRTAVAVWEVRDPDTGKVMLQFPREATIRAYRAHSAEAHGQGTHTTPTTDGK